MAQRVELRKSEYLHDEPVLACPASRWYRFGKFARRHKAGLALAAAAVVVGLLAVTGLVVSNARIRQAQTLAEERAEQIRQDLEHLRYADALLDRGRWYAGERRWDDAWSIRASSRSTTATMPPAG